MATVSVKGLITETLLWPASSDINTSREREREREGRQTDRQTERSVNKQRH